MLGVVLCGGLSSRMGTDKALLTFDTTNFAQKSLDIIDELQFPVVLSVNASQHNDYLSLFVNTPLIQDTMGPEIRGPLCGVLSVHLQYPNEDLLILACDMPFMDVSILHQLCNIYKTDNLRNAYVFSNNGEPEPLCGIYRSIGLAYIIQLLKETRLMKHSMKYILDQMKTLSMPLIENQKKYFKNINDLTDLNVM